MFKRKSTRSEFFTSEDRKNFSLADLEEIVISLAQAPRNAQVRLHPATSGRTEDMITILWDEK